MKLIDQTSKELIGEIELKYLPQKEDKISYKNENYHINEIIHSEENISFIVSKANSDISFF